LIDNDWLTDTIQLVSVVNVESLRVIAETFHAAKKLIKEDLPITDTKLDK